MKKHFEVLYQGAPLVGSKMGLAGMVGVEKRGHLGEKLSALLVEALYQVTPLIRPKMKARGWSGDKLSALLFEALYQVTLKMDSAQEGRS